jgi:hypothetical protein
VNQLTESLYKETKPDASDFLVRFLQTSQAFEKFTIFHGTNSSATQSLLYVRPVSFATDGSIFDILTRNQNTLSEWMAGSTLGASPIITWETKIDQLSNANNTTIENILNYAFVSTDEDANFKKFNKLDTQICLGKYCFKINPENFCDPKLPPQMIAQVKYEWILGDREKAKQCLESVFFTGTISWDVVRNFIEFARYNGFILNRCPADTLSVISSSFTTSSEVFESVSSVKKCTCQEINSLPVKSEDIYKIMYLRGCPIDPGKPVWPSRFGVRAIGKLCEKTNIEYGICKITSNADKLFTIWKASGLL